MRAGHEPAASSALAEPGIGGSVRRAWQRDRATELVMVDVVVVGASMVLAYFIRFGEVGDTSALRYGAVAALLLGGWMAMLAYSRVYEPRMLGIGTEEFRRVTSATFRTFGAVAIISYLLKLEVARGFVAIALPLGFVLLIAVRFLLRLRLQGARRRGESLHRVLAVGDPDGVVDLAAQMRQDAHAGFAVVGACVTLDSAGLAGPHLTDGTPVVGTVTDVIAAARACDADTVAVTAGMSIRSDQVRRIAWSLEGTNVDLVIAPAIADVAGPRITMRPVSGLPLIYVDEPQFTGGRRVVKRAVDVTGAALGLLLLSPLLLITAVLVKTTSRGPVLFKQTRTGKDGDDFRCWKFRTMHVDAEARWDDLRAGNEGDGLLFKIKDDPRITSVGRILRRTSIDELPQLVNVLRGDMSLVGPRPLAVADHAFEGDVRRRMLVRPGITGLWQVSGRGEQSWEDAVRLDLYYVENWSLSLDIAILLRTLLAVVRGTGA
jgi:exopolysaccharide biosynthesis polyprenyl glycosylphosphotransferase